MFSLSRLQSVRIAKGVTDLENKLAICIRLSSSIFWRIFCNTSGKYLIKSHMACVLVWHGWQARVYIDLFTQNRTQAHSRGCFPRIEHLPKIERRPQPGVFSQNRTFYQNRTQAHSRDFTQNRSQAHSRDFTQNRSQAHSRNFTQNRTGWAYTEKRVYIPQDSLRHQQLLPRKCREPTTSSARPLRLYALG